MPTNKNYFYGLGRRRNATARIWLKSGKANFIINGQPASDYFTNSKLLLHKLQEPFYVLELENKFDISVKVSGGGAVGQAEAIRLGVARALVLLNEDYKSTLRRAELLGRDSRKKERKKPGLKGARKQRQFTKR